MGSVKTYQSEKGKAWLSPSSVWCTASGQTDMGRKTLDGSLKSARLMAHIEVKAVKCTIMPRSSRTVRVGVRIVSDSLTTGQIGIDVTLEI